MDSDERSPRVRGVGLAVAGATGLVAAAAWSAPPPLPPGFVDARTIVPRLEVDLKYLTGDNFTGRPVEGYRAPRCILTREAAAALRSVQEELLPYGFGLKVFDAYRPQRAVDHFRRWSTDLADQGAKQQFYPRVAKGDLFRQGYLAEKSGHSRGSTVDLTLVVLAGEEPGAEFDMGSPFDFFGDESATDYAALAPAQRAHRLLLRTVMQRHGFRPYAKEWWHFTLEKEPFPDTYFDFAVE